MLMLGSERGLGHVPRDRNFCHDNILSGEDYLACFLNCFEICTKTVTVIAEIVDQNIKAAAVLTGYKPTTPL